jgi:hypothetical protein
MVLCGARCSPRSWSCTDDGGAGPGRGRGDTGGAEFRSAGGCVDGLRCCHRVRGLGCTGLLPQLVPVGAPVEATLLGLVVVHAVLTLVWLNAYAALLHRARDTFQRPRVRRAMERITGGVLIGFGVRVATQHG